ncbi:MAG: bifunctional serine/threonine-protein kinase/formylglycine-generating enzyme family protein [Planctomycetota bacterium]
MTSRPGGLDPEQRAIVDAWLARAERGEAESVADFVASHGFLDEVLHSVLARLDEGGGAATPDAPSSGSRFAVQRVLGAGGMGTVSLAWDTRLERLVALKRMRPELLDVAEVRRRFEIEARAASTLSHPNLCPVHDVGEVDGVPFIVMPFVEGRTLADQLAEARGTGTPPATAEVVDLLITLALAIDHAHERGLVHRDLKPGNVMIRPDGSPVVLDFGLVHDESVEGLTRSGMQPGTREYMAPEQVQPRGRRIDRRTDVWALGVILHECLTLQRPFGGDGEHELFQAILAAKLPRQHTRESRVPRDLEVVIATALAPEPERRYQTARALAEDLQRFRRHEPILARRASLGLRMLRFCRREPWAATTLAAVAVALVIVAILFRSADTNLRRFDALSRITKLGEATRSAAELVPAEPAMAPRLRAWLEEFGPSLLQMAAQLDAQIDELQAALPTEPEARKASGSSFLLEELRKARPALIAFAAPGGIHEGMRERLWWAENVTRLSVDEHRAEWDEAIRAIRDADASTVHAAYHGLLIAPQPGLVPLGPDPHSKLYEFYDLWTAERGAPIPTRDPQSGELQLDERAGIVFVLIPSIATWLGAQRSDPAAPCYDPAYDSRDPTEDTPRQVQLPPFLIGKHEVTQSQWGRHGDANPSLYATGFTDPDAHEVITGRNPVEHMSWTDADRWARTVGAKLPTNDQWEVACRAGGDHVFSFGDTPNAIARFANVIDATALRFEPSWAKDVVKDEGGVMPIDDHHLLHARVGSYQPNAFGLYDMHGNVGEWTAEGQPERENRYVRGGMFSQSVAIARCWYRIPLNLATSDPGTGLRAIRELPSR